MLCVWNVKTVLRDDQMNIIFIEKCFVCLCVWCLCVEYQTSYTIEVCVYWMYEWRGRNRGGNAMTILSEYVNKNRFFFESKERPCEYIWGGATERRQSPPGK